MARNSKETARNVAEERFEKAQRTTREAKAQIDAEGKARREKTSRLKALRMAKDAEEAAGKAAEGEAKAKAKIAEAAAKAKAKSATKKPAAKKKAAPA